ncbi:hypothetical protein Q3G72_004360 [Acer saccharum]|nr:hypothetical protein Q3G72_004360 [Acer saccharum]
MANLTLHSQLINNGPDDRHLTFTFLTNSLSLLHWIYSNVFFSLVLPTPECIIFFSFCKVQEVKMRSTAIL